MDSNLTGFFFQETNYDTLGIQIPADEEAGAQELRVVGPALQGQEEFYRHASLLTAGWNLIIIIIRHKYSFYSKCFLIHFFLTFYRMFVWVKEPGQKAYAEIDNVC